MVVGKISTVCDRKIFYGIPLENDLRVGNPIIDTSKLLLISPRSRNRSRDTLIMLVNCASALARAAATSSSSRASYQPVSSKVVDLVVTRRSMGSKLGEAQTASHAWKKSCYNGIDYTIGDDCTVLEAIQKLAAYDVGCLVTTDANGE